MKLWILCGTGRDISIRFALSIWQRRANSDEAGGHLLRFCRNSATGGLEFHCTCYSFNGKVQQVEYQFVGPTPIPLTVRHWKAWNSVWRYRIRCIWQQKRHRQADFGLKLCLTVLFWQFIFNWNLRAHKNVIYDLQSIFVCLKGVMIFP